MRQANILIFLNVSIWLVYAAFWITGSAEPMVSALALTSGWEAFLHRPWTILTYMLFHMSPIHLIVNILFLSFFLAVARDCDAGKVVVPLYLAGGIFGGLLYIIFGSGYMVGASAAVLAVVVGIGFSYSSHRIVVKGKYLPHAGIIAAVIAMITLPYVGDWSTWMAHVGGAFVGLVYLCMVFISQKRDNNVIKSGDAVTTSSSAEDYGRIAELKEKVRISGFNSLTAEERALLIEKTSEKKTS